MGSVSRDADEGRSWTSRKGTRRLVLEVEDKYSTASYNPRSATMIDSFVTIDCWVVRNMENIRGFNGNTYEELRKRLSSAGPSKMNVASWKALVVVFGEVVDIQSRALKVFRICCDIS